MDIVDFLGGTTRALPGSEHLPRSKGSRSGFVGQVLFGEAWGTLLKSHPYQNLIKTLSELIKSLLKTN